METPETTPEERPERETSLTREALGFVPGVGTALDVADIAQDVREKDYVGAGINTAAAVLGLIPGVGRVAGKGLKAATKAFRQADIDDAKKLMDDPDAKAAWQKESKNPFKQKRVPEVQEAAEKLSEGKITSREYRDTVKAYQPIQPITDENFPKLPTLKEIAGSLDENKVAKGIVGVNKNIPDGTRVGSRLDIPAYENYNTWVVSLHDGTKLGGNVIGYGQTAILKNVEFMTAAKGGLRIAKGADKTTIGRIHGDYFNADPEDVHELSKKLLNDPEWTQVGMNPFRHSFFYNKATGKPVFKADEVVQVGPLVLAKGVKTPSVSDLKTLKVKTPDKKIRMFNEGGDVMEDQMNFAFMNEGGVLADDGVERDPVSGNEVPSGSMAEEVRDDIPAMLSEGEYVVPADVVRYHGIEKFEDLRNEAKVGLQRMEADGRIGGQPVEEQDELPFSIEELQVTEAYRGGIMGFQEGGDTGSYEKAFGESFTPNQRYGSMGGAGLGFQIRNFTNPKTGKTIAVPFFNGKPMQYIPPEFTASDVAGSGGVTGGVSDDRDRQADEAQAARGSNVDGIVRDAVDSALGINQTQQTKPFSQYSPEEFGAYLTQRQSGIGQFIDNLPVLGPLLTMQDNSAREFARKSLIQGKNFVTGEPISNKEADILMQVADMPEGRSFLQVIDEFLQGKTSTPGGTYKGTKPIVVDDRPPIDTELRRTTYEPETPVDTTTAKAQPTQEYYGPEGFQNIIQPQQVLTDETPQTLENKPEKKNLAQKLIDTGISAISSLDPTFDMGAAYAGGMEGLDFSALDSEAYKVGLNDYNALSDQEKGRVQRLVRSEAVGEGSVGMATVFRSIITRYGLTKTGAVPLNTFNPGINLSGTDTLPPRTLTKENLTFNDIINGQRRTKTGNVIYQYSPVDDKSINRPLTKTQRASVAEAINLAQDTTQLAKDLFKLGLKQDQVFEVINSANFRRFDAVGTNTTDIRVGDHVFNAKGNEPYRANQQEIKDLTNKVLQDEPQPVMSFQNIIEPQQVDPTGLYGRGFTPSDIKPLEIEEMDLPPAQGVTPAVEVIEGTDYSDQRFKDMDQRATQRDVMSTFPKQVGIGPISEDAQTQLGLAQTFTADKPPMDDQMGALFAQDKSAVSKLMPQITPDFPPMGERKVTDAGEFLADRERSFREQQEKQIYDDAVQRRRISDAAAQAIGVATAPDTTPKVAPKTAPTTTASQEGGAPTPKLETLKASSQTRDAAKAQRARSNAQQAALDSGMSLSDSVDAGLRAEAETNLRVAAERNRKLNQGRTLTDVLEEEERESSGGGSSGGGGFGGGSSGGGDKSIVCTEIYRQTQLADWSKAMRVWDTYQRRYLTPEHEIGYHWLFRPYVSGMKKSNLLTRFGALMAGRRTQHLKHVLTKGKAKDDLFGNVFCKIIHPTVYIAGKIKNFLDGKTKAT